MKHSTLALALALTLLASRAEAGIVVEKNGNVFLGRIEPAEITDDKIVLHEPRLTPDEKSVRGPMTFERHGVRWFDVESDEPTLAYVKLFPDAPIQARWARRIDILKTPPPVIVGDPFDWTRHQESLSSLAIPLRTGGDELTIRKPAGWNAKTVGEILMLESDHEGADGFAARIHVFSVDSVGAPRDQLDWARAELGRAGAAVLEATEPRVVRGGSDVALVTATHVAGKTIKALRLIAFREHRTTFVTAYAHERDFDGLRLLLGTALGTLTIHENATATERLSSVVGHPVTPTRVADETIAVGGSPLACAVYEVSVLGKLYRLRLSPGTETLTVDGVPRELTPIK